MLRSDWPVCVRGRSFAKGELKWTEKTDFNHVIYSVMVKAQKSKSTKARCYTSEMLPVDYNVARRTEQNRSAYATFNRWALCDHYGAQKEQYTMQLKSD